MMQEQKQQQLDTELIAAVRDNAPERVQAALDAGANAALTVPETQRSLLFDVAVTHYSEAPCQVLAQLLNAGADAQSRDDAGNNLIHAFVNTGASGAVAQLLEAGVDPLAVNDSGITPLKSITNYSAHMVNGKLHYAMELPRAVVDESLTHDALFQGDYRQDCPMDNSLSWHAFPQIVAQLQKNGEPPITKDDLLACDKTGKPRIARAVLCHNWNTVQDYLTERGEPMTHQDLIRPDGVGDQITMALAAREQLRPFFSAKYWQDKPRLELQETWNKLHEESREGLGSIYILLHKLEQMQQSHEMGR